MEGGYVPILGSWVRNTNSIPDTEAFPSLIDLTMTTDREEDASLGGALSCLKTLFGILLCGGSEVALTVALLTLASNAEPQASQKCYTLCTVYWKHKVLYRPCHHFSIPFMFGTRNVEVFSGSLYTDVVVFLLVFIYFLSCELLPCFNCSVCGLCVTFSVIRVSRPQVDFI